MNPIRRIAKVIMNQTDVLIQKQKDLNKYLYDNLYFILIPLFILIFLYIFYISISDFSNISQRFFITLVIIKSINILLSAFLIISFSSFLYYEINPDYKMIDFNKSNNQKDFISLFATNTFMPFLKILNENKLIDKNGQFNSFKRKRDISIALALINDQGLLKYKSKRDLHKFSENFFKTRIDYSEMCDLIKSINDSNESDYPKRDKKIIEELKDILCIKL